MKTKNNLEYLLSIIWVRIFFALLISFFIFIIVSLTTQILEYERNVSLFNQKELYETLCENKELYECFKYQASKIINVNTIEGFSILAAGSIFILESYERQKQKIYEAWQVVDSVSDNAPTSYARIQALENLNGYKISLAAINLPSAYLKRIYLKNANLSEANLENTNFLGANLEGVNFSHANLEDANFEGANLANTNLSYANLENANFEGANLRNANLSSSNIMDANLRNTVLNNANFTNSIYSKDTILPFDFNYNRKMHCIFPRANLQDADLSNIDLKGINLQNCFLINVNFENCDLSNANLENAVLINANLKNANLFQANLKNADLSLANLRNANFKEANLTNAKLIKANIIGANLRTAITLYAVGRFAIYDKQTKLPDDRFYLNSNNMLLLKKNSDYRGQDLNNLDLESVNLSNCNLTLVDFSNSDLSNSNISDSDLRGSLLTNVNLKNTNLENADIRGVNIKDANLDNTNLKGVKKQPIEISRSIIRYILNLIVKIFQYIANLLPTLSFDLTGRKVDSAKSRKSVRKIRKRKLHTRTPSKDYSYGRRLNQNKYYEKKIEVENNLLLSSLARFIRLFVVMYKQPWLTIVLLLIVYLIYYFYEFIFSLFN